VDDIIRSNRALTAESRPLLELARADEAVLHCAFTAIVGIAGIEMDDHVRSVLVVSDEHQRDFVVDRVDLLDVEESGYRQVEVEVAPRSGAPRAQAM
jgi:hypothetical protein